MKTTTLKSIVAQMKVGFAALGLHPKYYKPIEFWMSAVAEAMDEAVVVTPCFHQCDTDCEKMKKKFRGEK